MREIRTSSGAIQYLAVLLTETSGKNISGDTYELSLGAYDTPGTWFAPTVEIVTTSQVRVKALVGAGQTINPAPGTYWLWYRVTDTPEVDPERVDERIVIK